MKGSGIKTCLENAAFNIDPTDVNEYPGFGYQLSGLNVTIVVAPDNAGNRVTELQVMDIDGTFSDVIEDQIYNVALPSFLAGSATKFQKEMRGVFDDSVLNHTVGEMKIYEALKVYIENNPPLAQEIDGRLRITSSGANITETCFLSSILSLILILLLKY